MRAPLFRMVMQENAEIYPGSGKRRPYVQWGGENLYYLAPKCLYRGEYKRGMEYGSATKYGVVLCVPYLFPGPSFYSSKERLRVHA